MIGGLRTWAPRAPVVRTPRSVPSEAGAEGSLPRPARRSSRSPGPDGEPATTRGDRDGLARGLFRSRSHRALAEHVREVLDASDRRCEDRPEPAAPLPALTRPAA